MTSELTSKWITFNNTQSNFTPISLITFAVINQTLPTLQGSCRNTSRWNTQSNFTPISLITFAVINQTSPNLQVSCRNNSQCCLQNYMENGWELTSELTSKWINFINTQSNFTPSSLITFAVINQTSPNLRVSCRNNSQCCLQKYMESTIMNWRLNWRLNE